MTAQHLCAEAGVEHGCLHQYGSQLPTFEIKDVEFQIGLNAPRKRRARSAPNGHMDAGLSIIEICTEDAHQ